ncbi:MAG: hypothetical protein ACOY81_09615 [Bacillota bacterium]|uniref:hypothetical protein n=1 Tax=Desulfurispora thermophila TaxID=265470 RepID=UPI000371A028|nr:hypothetical protein [Desulfurispora thermophila]
MPQHCPIARQLKDNYADRIKLIVKQEKVEEEVAVCSFLCPEIKGCIEDVEDVTCAWRLKMLEKQ